MRRAFPGGGAVRGDPGPLRGREKHPAESSGGTGQPQPGGIITADGRDTSRLPDNAPADCRASAAGFVFPFCTLIPTLTVYENVQPVPEPVPGALNAREMLSRAGPGDHLRRFPAQLSGGAQQRLLTAPAGEYEMKPMPAPFAYAVSLPLAFGVSPLPGIPAARKDRRLDMAEALKAEQRPLR